jgi:ABC-2 type transport system ATP-binding protein
MLTANQLTYSYGTRPVLNELTFEVKPGECFGLLGPNGAGKSTTIGILCGLLKPMTGQVSFNGSQDTRVRQAALGLVPQNLAIYDEMTAEENLAFFGKVHGLFGNGLRERVDYCLRIAALADRRRDRADTFSGGMKRRLNLAIGLIHNPTMILLDEPTAGVDPQSRNLLFDTFLELKRQGRTLLYTTHYMEEAQRLCDRVAIMDSGRILDCGTVPELVSRHGGPATIMLEFSEAPSMDSLPAGAQLEGAFVRIESFDPVGDLATIHNLRLRPLTVTVQPPSLEAVFLHLTGKSLRDE